MAHYSFYSRSKKKPRRSLPVRAGAKNSQITKLAKEEGFEIQPVPPLQSKMKIATSFWGRSWCQHLESYSDYENRLPRGRTYLRAGSVLHLAVEKGKITALVQGSSLYRQTIQIAPLPPEKWEEIQSRCRGKIGSLIELLQGKISDEIMAVVADRENGLFPSPSEIKLFCSCPDWADVCKHIAATLYGFGAKLDASPELLFLLRGVEVSDLISSTETVQAIAGTGKRRKTIEENSIGDIFGINLDDDPPPLAAEEPAIPAQPPAPEKLPKIKKKTAAPAKAQKAQKTKSEKEKKTAGKKPESKPTKTVKTAKTTTTAKPSS